MTDVRACFEEGMELVEHLLEKYKAEPTPVLCALLTALSHLHYAAPPDWRAEIEKALRGCLTRMTVVPQKIPRPRGIA